MKKVILLSFLFVFFGMVHAQESKQSKKQKKELAAKENMEKTRALVESKKFEFTGNFMFPQNGQRVSMLTPPNTLKINGNTVTSNLPFIGTKQFTGANSGMMFEGDMEDYKMEFVDKKNEIRLRFKHKDGTETFSFQLDIAPDGYTYIVASSNKRTTITYSGNITALKEQ